MEGLDAFQLEAGHLHHGHIRLFAHASHSGQRVADIACHMGDTASIFKDLPHQRGGGGFTVCTGDGHHIAAEQRRSHFQLAGNGHALFLGSQHHGRINGHTGADEQDIRFLQQLDGILAQMEHAGRATQAVQRIAEGFFLLAVSQNGNRAMVQQQFCRGNTTSCHAQHQNALIG